MHIQRQRETFAYRYAAVNQDLVDRLHGEFKEWRKQQPKGSIFGGGMIGGIDHWPNIERFLKDRYPAAHRGFDMGYENARPLLDSEEDWKEWDDDEKAWLPGASLYETGPEAEAQYGYDPKEIAAGMLLLHNKTDRFRGDLSQEDQQRLTDIAQKRYQMQRNYEQRQANSRFRFAADLVKNYTDQLYDEFHDWGKENKFPVHYDEWDYTKPMGGPLTYWDNIEGFLKDRYPAAHRDYRYGEENASDALDGNTLRMPARNSPWPYRSHHPPYETGPEAVAKYGYDPRQVAAGFMYLHTWSHAQSPQNQWRGDKLPRDIDRLSDIFQKRQQMQQHYENLGETTSMT